MDVQLQQMTEDLKEIIRHINDSNKPLDKSDPVSFLISFVRIQIQFLLVHHYRFVLIIRFPKL